MWSYNRKGICGLETSLYVISHRQVSLDLTSFLKGQSCAPSHPRGSEQPWAPLPNNPGPRQSCCEVICLAAPWGVTEIQTHKKYLLYAGQNLTFRMKFCVSHESDSPIDEQILLNSKALTPRVALGPVLGPPRLRARLLFGITFQVWKLHQLVFFHCTVQPGLLPHSWSVNNQVVLKKTADNFETSKKAPLACSR